MESEKPEVVSQATKVQSIYSEMNEIQAKIEKLYARWAELERRAKNQ